MGIETISLGNIANKHFRLPSSCVTTLLFCAALNPLFPIGYGPRSRKITSDVMGKELNSDRLSVRVSSFTIDGRMRSGTCAEQENHNTWTNLWSIVSWSEEVPTGRDLSTQLNTGQEGQGFGHCGIGSRYLHVIFAGRSWGEIAGKGMGNTPGTMLEGQSGVRGVGSWLEGTYNVECPVRGRITWSARSARGKYNVESMVC